MKKIEKFLLMGFFLLSQLALQAQDNVVSLQKLRLKLPDCNYYVNHVIDARLENCNIGFINNGYNGSKRPVTIEGELGVSLHSLFKSNYDDTTGKIPVITKINKLALYDYSGTNYLNIVLEVNFDFYVREDDKYYHEFTAGQFVNFTESKQIDKMIVQAVENSFYEFQYRMKNNLGYHKVTPENELYENSLSKKTSTTINRKSKKNRIYHTFNGFRDDIADTISKFTTKNLPSNYNLPGFMDFDFGDEGVEKSIIWGVFFRNKVYIQIAGVFVPVKISDTTYIPENLDLLEKRQKELDKSLEKLAFWGGLSGSIIADKVGLGTNVEYKGVYKIDMSTGRPVPLETPEIQLSNYQLIFYLSKNTYFDLELYFDNKKGCNLKPYSFYPYTVKSTDKQLNICLKSVADEFCNTISTDFCNDIYFEVVVKKDGKVSFVQVDDQNEKSSIIKLIEKDKLTKIQIR